ncbi:MAG: hypothetical protein AB8B58_04440, partial [Roseobacter sp.]
RRLFFSFLFSNGARILSDRDEWRYRNPARIVFSKYASIRVLSALEPKTERPQTHRESRAAQHK